MKIEKIKLNKIKPYWRNPRKNSDAVELIKKSISAYGYNQPIVVDNDYVIVAGHTRFMALTELGKDEVEIIKISLDPQKAKEYRIVDNKSNEIALWDNDKLMQELKEISNIEELQQYFPEDNLDRFITENLENNPINHTDESIEKSYDIEQDRFVNPNNDGLYKVMCPHCLKDHYVNREDVLGYAPESKK